MPMSFDESEYADTESSTAMSEAVGDVMAEVEETQAAAVAATQSIEKLNDEVERRLEVATFYRLLLNDNLFTQVSEASQVVETEIRAFVIERLEILLGIRKAKAEPAPSVFSDEEVGALKALSAKVLGKPAILHNSGPTKPQPEIKKSTPVQPKQVLPPAPPALKQREGVKIPAKKMVVVPTSRPKSIAPVPTKTTPGDGQTQTIQHADGSQETLTEGEVVEKNGRKFKVVMNEMGTLYKKDVTGPVVLAGRVPLPTNEQISMLSEQQALNQVKGQSDITKIAIAHSLHSQQE